MELHRTRTAPGLEHEVHAPPVRNAFRERLERGIQVELGNERPEREAKSLQAVRRLVVDVERVIRAIEGDPGRNRVGTADGKIAVAGGCADHLWMVWEERRPIVRPQPSEASVEDEQDTRWAAHAPELLYFCIN